VIEASLHAEDGKQIVPPMLESAYARLGGALHSSAASRVRVWL